MAIIKNDRKTKKRIIDLTGPEGNAFTLLGIAAKWGSQLGYNLQELNDELTSGDYENLITVFDKYFGSLCDLER